jgi:hypothetical protein
MARFNPETICSYSVPGAAGEIGGSRSLMDFGGTDSR